MSQLIIPHNYKAALSLQQTEIAIKKIKDFFLSNISTELRLRRVTAPLFVLKGLGMNDDLSGTERPVSFPIKDMQEAEAEVVHSLAKWKRVTLAEYKVDNGYGIITVNCIKQIVGDAVSGIGEIVCISVVVNILYAVGNTLSYAV